MGRHEPVGRARTWVAAGTSVLAVLVFVACGGASSHSAPAPVSSSTLGTTRSAAPDAAAFPDVAPTAGDVENLDTMTRSSSGTTRVRRSESTRDQLEPITERAQA